jgi:putative membrane protein
MNISLLSNELWHWTSPAWLVAVAALLAYLLVFRTSLGGRLAAMVIGLAIYLFVFISPIGVLADGFLFSAHMVQHLVLLLIVPLCVLMSLPRKPLQKWAERSPLARRLEASWLPLVGWFAGLGVMWFWHVPTFCSASTLNYPLGVLRDATFLLAGLLFWWPVFSPVVRQRLQAPVAVVYLFSACLGCTLLGIYITFTTISVCPAFANPTNRLGIVTWLYDLGLTPAADQHLGGLCMWVPPCTLYVSAILAVLWRWYNVTETSPAISDQRHADVPAGRLSSQAQT